MIHSFIYVLMKADEIYVPPHLSCSSACTVLSALHSAASGILHEMNCSGWREMLHLQQDKGLTLLCCYDCGVKVFHSSGELIVHYLTIFLNFNSKRCFITWKDGNSLEKHLILFVIDVPDHCSHVAELWVNQT